LTYAAKNGHYEMCKLLVEDYNASLYNGGNSDSQMIFHDSIKSKNIHTFKYLMNETDKVRKIQKSGE
jgi:hypothetical protein